MRRFSLLILVTIIYFPGFSQPSGYGYGKEITIQSSKVSGSSDLVDFPVLISLTDTTLRTTANGGDVENSNGYDIIFTLDDCSTQLDHQIEKYDQTTGEYVAWVRIPSLSSSSNTVIHMYYGNSSISSDPSTSDTWDGYYNGVWHLNDDFTDGTSTGNDLTNSGSSDITGKIADAQDFDGSDKLTNSNPTVPVGNSSYTIEAWFKADNFGSRGIIGWGSYGNSQKVNALRTYNSSGGFRHYWWGNDLDYTSSLSTGTWYFVVANFDGTTRRIYLNGTQVVSDNPGSSHNSNNSNFKIGETCDYCGGGEYFDGIIDEVRVSDTARSADWIATEYNNQNDPSSFYTISSQYSAGTLCSLPIELMNFDLHILKNAIVELNWQTASEINNDYFIVERSKEGNTWENLNKIMGAGNSLTPLNYVAFDNNPYPGRSYYRLKQKDINGQTSYSKVKSINLTGSEISSIHIYPNPTKNSVSVEGNNPEIESIRIYNFLGQDITGYTKFMRQADNRVIINLSNLDPGMYYIKTGITAEKVYKQ